MIFNEKPNSNYLAIYELTKEIGSITKNSIYPGIESIISLRNGVSLTLEI